MSVESLLSKFIAFLLIDEFLLSQVIICPGLFPCACGALGLFRFFWQFRQLSCGLAQVRPACDIKSRLRSDCRAFYGPDCSLMTKSYVCCERLSLSIRRCGSMIEMSSLDGIDGSNAHLLQGCRPGADGPFQVAFDLSWSLAFAFRFRKV